MNINHWLLELDEEYRIDSVLAKSRNRWKGGMNGAGSGSRMVDLGLDTVGNGVETPPSIESTIERSEEMKGLTHLIMVAGHAIWKG